MTIRLGDRVKDVYTAFTGIAAARTEWLTGCDRILIEPEKLDKDGKVQEGCWFDESRVELVKAQAVKVAKASKAAEAESPKRRGGPRPDPRSDRAGG